MSRRVKLELAISISVALLFFGMMLTVIYEYNVLSGKCAKKWPGSTSEGPLLHPRCVEKRVLGEPQ